ncbi:TonB-dependent receptor [Sphingobium algorifonticola]|uniref:TonB-dependent receptor n=1 Tax=Sphingobium algorifonticola TaxID=2008318 RepID=UPI0013E34B4E|nr:TonB-dependent receptor [Sphingobium algorifonticola]
MFGRLVPLSALVFILATQPAIAQSVETPAEEQDDGIIVVTAQKRSENLQNVPISIAALSAAKLNEANVLTVQDLARVVTNFSATRTSQAASIRLTVRGIGTASNNANEPSVAAFVDGVYVPRPGSIIGNFLDMEGVEVLRGPQGTLFGRNASVGAISFRTGQPTGDFSGQIRAEGGTGDRYLLTGNVNVPLSESLSVRVAGLASTSNGLFNNRLDGKTYGGSDDYAGRVTLKAVTGNLTWLLRGDYAKSDGDGYVTNEFDVRSVSPAQLQNFLNVQTRLAGSANDLVRFDRNVNQFVTADLTDENWGVSSDATVEVGSFSVRLINSYRSWDSEQLDGDSFNTPIEIGSRIAGFSSRSHNHELQLISPQKELLNGRLDFVAGVYFFREDFAIDERLQLNRQFCDFSVPPNQVAQCNALLRAGGGVDATDLDFSQSVESFAVYSQANLKIAEGLTATLGGRWTTERKNGSFVQTLANPFAASLRRPESVALRLRDNRFTWRGALSYQPKDDVLLFASYSTGFKSGGFNSGGGTEVLGLSRRFDRETVDNYEVGAKTSWLNNALQANLTFYRMDIDGFQDRSFDGLSFVVRNAGTLRHQGFEFDTRIAPSRNFVVNASLGYIDSEFTSYVGASALPGLGSRARQDLTGGRSHFAPEFTGAFGATWSGDIGKSGLRWSLNGNLSYISDLNNGSVTDNNPQTVQDGYALLNGRFQISGPADRWNIAVFANNITDKGYCVAQFYQVLDTAFALRNGVFNGSTGVRCAVGQPRTIGVSGTFNF